MLNHVEKLQREPGIATGAIDLFPTQTLGGILITDEHGWVSKPKLSFDDLNDIQFSELLRDLDSLRK